MRRRMMAMLAVVMVAGCSESSGPVASLAGSWNLTAFREDGLDASTASGTMNFAAGGAVNANVVIAFPGEAPDTVVDAGTWSQNGRTLTMTIGGDTGTWLLTFSNNDQTVQLQLQADASASLLTLQRP